MYRLHEVRFFRDLDGCRRPLPECIFNLIKQYHSIIFLSRYILKLNFKPVYYIYYLYKYTALFIIYILILQERIYSFSNSSVLLYVAKMLQFVAEVLHCNKTNTILSFYLVRNKIIILEIS